MEDGSAARSGCGYDGLSNRKAEPSCVPARPNSDSQIVELMAKYLQWEVFSEHDWRGSK